MNTYYILTIISFLLCYTMTNGIMNLLLRSSIRFVIVLFTAQLLLAEWDPYNVYPLSFSAYLVFQIQILLITIGAKRDDKLRYIPVSYASNNRKWPTITINSFALFLITALLLYTLWNYRRMNAFLLTEATMSQEVREFYFSSFFPSYSLRVFDSFITSFKYLALILSFGMVLSYKRFKIKDWYFIVSSIAICILQSLISQSRLEILVIVVIFLFFVFYAKNYDNQTFKRRVIPLLAVLLGGFVIIFLITTLLRLNMTKDQFSSDMVDELILEPFATYFYIPILAFDFGRENVINFSYPYCGAATLSSIVDTILLPFVAIEKSFNSFTMDQIIGKSIGVGTYFPSGKHWMAMYTGCANYYMDFWYFGIVIFSFLHGKIISILSNKAINNPIFFVVAAYFFYCSFRHTTQLGIQSTTNMFFLFWVWVIYRRKLIQ